MMRLPLPAPAKRARGDTKNAPVVAGLRTRSFVNAQLPIARALYNLVQELP